MKLALVVIGLFLLGSVALAQPQQAIIVLPGSPPGGLGAACTTPALFYGNLNTGVIAGCVGGVWTAISGGTGNVVGPASSTDTAFALFNGTTGKIIMNSVGLLDASGNVTGLRSIALGGAANPCDGTSGCEGLAQGTPNSGQGTNMILRIAPVSVTSYTEVMQGTACSGVQQWLNSSNTVTRTCSALGSTAVPFVDANGLLTSTVADFFYVNGSQTLHTVSITTGDIYAGSLHTHLDSAGVTIGTGANARLNFTPGFGYDTPDVNINRLNTTTVQIGTANTADATGTLLLAKIGLGSTQTTVSGSTSGTAVFAEPFTGSSYKKVVIFLNALLGTASYTYPTAFTNTPSCFASGAVACGILTSTSTSAVTATGATSTGYIVLEGY